MEIAIEARDLSKSFYDMKKGEICALKSVSFKCYSGRITGILGPNGAGKTTLLRIIASLIQPSSGSIEIKGVENDQRTIRTSIGFLSGDTALYERLTAYEMLVYCSELYGLQKSSIEERIAEFSSLLHMDSILHRLCKNLSTGEKQKVSITRAMLHDPKIIILDEPTNGLDLISSKDILWLVKEMKKRGKTILYSAHHMEEIEKICDDILLIYGGRIIESGSQEELLKRNNSENMTECFLKLVKNDEL